MNILNRILNTTNASDPLLLAAAGVSLVLILLFLYGGGWRLITHLLVQILIVAYSLAVLTLLLAAGYHWLRLVFVEPDERAVTLLRAITFTGSVLAVGFIMGNDNFVTRGLKRCNEFLTFRERTNA